MIAPGVCEVLQLVVAAAALLMAPALLASVPVVLETVLLVLAVVVVPAAPVLLVKISKQQVAVWAHAAGAATSQGTRGVLRVLAGEVSAPIC